MVLIVFYDACHYPAPPKRSQITLDLNQDPEFSIGALLDVFTSTNDYRNGCVDFLKANSNVIISESTKLRELSNANGKILFVVQRKPGSADDDFSPRHHFSSFTKPKKESTQIKINRLPTKQYQSGPNTNTTCDICCEELKTGDVLRVLPCFHQYHSNCVDSWLNLKPTCPSCRTTAFDNK